ncbi:MAG: FAD-dependent oxidoreductase [Candidatus Micrarchaeia archaeon]
MERKEFVLSSVRLLAVSLLEFSFSPLDGKNIKFEPGQFVMLHQLENGSFGKLSRAFSIASSPLNPELRFVIKITGGAFTSILSKMKPGDRVGVSGPFGNFAFRGEERIVCIAAGTGVAPMVGILEYVSQKKLDGKFTLFYSAKTESLVACRGLLDSFQASNPGIKVVYSLTRETPSGWKHELGRIDSKMMGKYADYAKDATVFICGPAEFSKAMKGIMLGLGTSEVRIKAEAWG